MHLGDGAMTTECAVLGFVGAATGMGLCYRLSRASAGRVDPLAVAACGSVVFAAQMLNLPLGAHSSAHWIGGTSLAFLFGPWIAVQTMGIVLLLQAILLGDGSLSAWGVNVFNMGIVPALLFSAVERVAGRTPVTLFVSSAASVMLAALLIPLEIACGRTAAELASWQSFLSAMLLVHVGAAALEGMLSVAGNAVWQLAARTPRAVAIRPYGAMLVAIALAGTSVYLSSAMPDGYEFSAESTLAYLLAAGDLPSFARWLADRELVLAIISTLLFSIALYGWIEAGKLAVRTSRDEPLLR